MLTMLEEVVLLAVDQRSGELRSTREYSTAYALVGAVIFDLALAHKIDTDTEEVAIINTASTGNALLDRVLAHMAQRPDLKTVSAWIEEIFHMRDDLEGEALASLGREGILRHEKSKLLWIIDVERFPLVDDKPQQHVRLRLANAILTDGIPATRDIMLVSIAEPCGLLPFVLGEDTIALRRHRIRLLCGLETISRKVSDAIVSLETSLRQVMHKVV
jgi:hypothetical protein